MSVDCESRRKKLQLRDAFRSSSSTSSGCSSVDVTSLTRIEMESLRRSKSLVRIQRVRFDGADEAQLPLQHASGATISESQFSAKELHRSIREAKYNTLDPRRVAGRIREGPINHERAQSKQHRRAESLLGHHDNWQGCHECCSIDDKRSRTHIRAANNDDHGHNRIRAAKQEFIRRPKDTKSKPQLSKEQHSKVQRPQDTLRRVDSGQSELQSSESGVHFRLRPMLVPVPPPVIPLYKELEMLGDRAKLEQLHLQLQRQRQRQTTQPKRQEVSMTENDSINYHCAAINGSCAEIYENIAKYDQSCGNSLEASAIIDELDSGARLHATEWEDLHEKSRSSAYVSSAVGQTKADININIDDNNNNKICASTDRKCIKLEPINEKSAQKRHRSLTQSEPRKPLGFGGEPDDSNGQHKPGYERHVEQLNGSKGLGPNSGWKCVVRRLKRSLVSLSSAPNQSTAAAGDKTEAPSSQLYEHSRHEAAHMSCDSRDKTAWMERLLRFDRNLKTRQTLSQSAGDLLWPDTNHMTPTGTNGAAIGANMGPSRELHNMDNNVYDTPEYNASSRLARPTHGPKLDSVLNAQRPSMPPPPPPPPPLACDECGSTNSANTSGIYSGIELSADCAIAAPLGADRHHSTLSGDIASRRHSINANETRETRRPEASRSNLILKARRSADGESRPHLARQGERQQVRTFEATPSKDETQVSTSDDTSYVATQKRKSARQLGLIKDKSESISNLQFSSQFQLSKDILISTETRVSKDKGSSNFDAGGRPKDKQILHSFGSRQADHRDDNSAEARIRKQIDMGAHYSVPSSYTRSLRTRKSGANKPDTVKAKQARKSWDPSSDCSTNADRRRVDVNEKMSGSELEILIEQSDVFIHPESKIKQHEKFLADCLYSKKRPPVNEADRDRDREDVSQSNENKANASGGYNIMSTDQKPSEPEPETSKDMYKISITTASIDQKSNQLRLTTPKIIVPTSDTSAGPQSIQDAKAGELQPASVASSQYSCSTSKAKASRTVVNLNGSASDNRDQSYVGLSATTSTTSFTTLASTKPLAKANKAFLVEYEDSSKSQPEGDKQRVAVKVDAKVTAISIENPVRSPKPSLNLDQILTPLLNNKPTATSESAGSVCNQETLDNSRESTDSTTSNPRELADEDASKHLTCRLNVGDGIKITSASIRLLETGDMDPIATRDEATESVTIPINTKPPLRSLSNKRRNFLINSPAINHDSEQLDHFEAPLEASKELESEDYVLEYSPILTSVKSYIDTFQEEFKSRNLSAQCDLMLPITIARDSSGPTMATISAIATSSSTIIKSNDMVIGNAAPKSGPASLVSSSMVTPIDGPPVTVASIESESPKRSIFDGASKDEILEYLEDARERVPEILMAADDVMVLNENELIVVNQLDPEAPATPISIVAATEVIETPAGQSNLDDEKRCITNCTATGSSSSVIATDQQLVKRQIFYQNQHSSEVTDANTIDEDTGISGVSGNEESYDDPGSCMSNRNSFSPTDMMNDAGNTVGRILIEHPLENTFEALDKFTLETLTRDRFEPNALSDYTTALERDALEQTNVETDHIASSAAALCPSTQNSTDLPRPRCNSLCETQTSDLSEARYKCEQRSVCRLRKLNLIREQRYLANRDSLSSASSTSPSSSSASPSSNESSNSSSEQTSGNCSVTSTFYASSSLSCSSPLLMTSMVSTATPTNNTSSMTYSKGYFTETALSQADNSAGGQNFTSSAEIESIHSKPAYNSVVDTSREIYEASYNGYIDLAPVSNGPLLAQINYCSESGAESLASFQTMEPKNDVTCDDEKLDTSRTEIEPDSRLGGRTLDYSVCAAEGQTVDQNTVATTNSNTVATKDRPAANVINPISLGKGNQKPNNRILSRSSLCHNYSTLNRLNYYLMNIGQEAERLESGVEASDELAKIDFQCPDCDQFLDIDKATMLNKTNERFRLANMIYCNQNSQVKTAPEPAGTTWRNSKNQPISADQLDRAYIAAINGLPLCKSCEKKRSERKEIISEFVETELKYGRDLRIIHDEFLRPMQIAGLLNKDQISGVFLNLDELILANGRFYGRLEAAINEAQSLGDIDFNTVNIGKLFVESAEMLHSFESYCIRQGLAACLLARLAKEKELLRIFLRVSQMENTQLRRMNLAAFLMVPVQRVTRYPLLLNRLYKVTAYHHKDRETLRDAQLRVELHLEHINQQTKGVGATNKIWRRISNLSTPVTHRRGLINAEDIGTMKLRKTALELLQWDRDETQFIHSGKLHFAPLNEFMVKQKVKSLRFTMAHALLVVLGRPNWKYQPELVKSNLDNRLMTPTPGGTGIQEAALVLFREKNNRFVLCHEPIMLKNCVLSNDCSQCNSETCPLLQQVSCHSKSGSSVSSNSNQNGANRTKKTSFQPNDQPSLNEIRSASVESQDYDSGSSKSSLATSSNTSQYGITKRTGSTGSGCVSSTTRRISPEIELSTSRSLTSRRNSPSLGLQPKDRSSLSSGLDSGARTSKGELQATNPYPNGNSTILNQLKTKINSYSRQASHGNSRIPDILEGRMRKASLNSCDKSNAIETSGNSSQSGQNNASNGQSVVLVGSSSSTSNHDTTSSIQYSHHYINTHHQPYGDYEESFELHERLTKESLLIRADTTLKTRYWLQMLRYHAKDLGQWRQRRHGLSNIMVMRQ